MKLGPALGLVIVLGSLLVTVAALTLVAYVVATPTVPLEHALAACCAAVATTICTAQLASSWVRTQARR